VGGARIYDALGLVVTQPTAGTYEGFSSACTHQGCALNSVQADNIVCPCHGSRFGLDGSVVTGPAQRPLDPRPVTVTDGEITLA
jgi:Rieske Fe-S protein